MGKKKKKQKKNKQEIRKRKGKIEAERMKKKSCLKKYPQEFRYFAFIRYFVKYTRTHVHTY